MSSNTPQRPDYEALISRLRAALKGPLPGSEAHHLALPESERYRSLRPGVKIQHAAVMLVLHPDESGSGITFPLVRRPDSMARHAGQVALPGGGREEGESAIDCAKREAWEEVSLDPSLVEIVGKLTKILIPITGYSVDTIVGWTGSRPELRRQEEEVIRIIHADPDTLARHGPTEVVEREKDGEVLKFPAYSVDGEIVWGATALILSEFLSIWRGVRGIDPPGEEPQIRK